MKNDKFKKFLTMKSHDPHMTLKVTVINKCSHIVDITDGVEYGKVMAHGCFLAAASEVFAAMIEPPRQAKLWIQARYCLSRFK